MVQFVLLCKYLVLKVLVAFLTLPQLCHHRSCDVPLVSQRYSRLSGSMAFQLGRRLSLTLLHPRPRFESCG